MPAEGGQCHSYEQHTVEFLSAAAEMIICFKHVERDVMLKNIAELIKAVVIEPEQLWSPKLDPDNGLR